MWSSVAERSKKGNFNSHFLMIFTLKLQNERTTQQAQRTPRRRKEATLDKQKKALKALVGSKPSVPFSYLMA